MDLKSNSMKNWKADWQKPKTKRNNQIRKYYSEGKRIVWLCGKYNLSRTSIYKILNKQAQKQPVYKVPLDN